MKRLAILFSLFIVLVIVLADLKLLGIMKFINRIPYGDKAGHFILYGILTLLIDLAYMNSLPNLRRQLVATRVGIVLALLIGLEEFSQRYFPSRTSDWVDLAFSYLGLVVFTGLALKIKAGQSDKRLPR